MKCLETLLEQECLEKNLEDFLVYYSTPPPKPLEPTGMSMGDISAYADSLNKQFGVPSPTTKPQTPSPMATAETFSPLEVINSLKKSYTHSVSQEEINYANNLNQQSGVPSPNTAPQISSPLVTAQTFNPNPVIDAVKNPICPSIENKPITVSSPPVKQHLFAPAYNPPQLKVPEPIIPKFEPPKLPLPLINPGKIFYDNFKKTHNIRTSGLKDINPVYDLFKRNEFPVLYNRFSKGLKLGKHAVKTITFTNPLKNENDFGPLFVHGERELRIPAIKPKKIPFDIMPQKDYNKMLNNAFLPHELGHAKVEEGYNENYPGILYKPELKGFHEHLADTYALDSVKNTPQLFNTRTERIKFENEWVTPPKNSIFPSRAAQNYDDNIRDEKDVTLIPGKQATINMLGEPLLKQKYDITLQKTLDLKYGSDIHKETVYNNINKLSDLYQESAIKLVDLSKRNSIFPDFQTKKILSRVEKESLRFMEDL